MSIIVPIESKLRHLPANILPRQRVIFDGIRYAAEVAEFSFEKLCDSLFATSKNYDQGVKSFVEPFHFAWAFVDSVNRIRPLLSMLPRAESSPEVQAFLSATDEARSLRDNIQHLYGRADRVASLRSPAWGVITWVYVVTEVPPLVESHVLVSGMIHDSRHELENPIGKAIVPPLDLVRLKTEEYSIYQKTTLRHVETIVRYLETIIGEQSAGIPDTGSDLHAKMTFDYKGPIPQDGPTI
jgi:hypothetical protein